MLADLHVHSRHSAPSTDWFMERWNIAESYSDPFSIYEKATKAGMSLVTITDHDSIDGCLLLADRYGERVLTGVESTASFPEDGCKVHVLIYGIGPDDFAEIEALRRNIYELRDYIRERDLAHSIAHATHSVEAGQLTPAHLEKLIVLFNTFEVINGGRNRADNLAWQHILEGLTPDCVHALARKHSLDPFDARPWVKGFTGGSDDHGGIFVGRTFTKASVTGAEGFLEALKARRTSAGGRYSDYETLAFSVYKVVHDFSSQAAGSPSSLLGALAETLFSGKRVSVLNRIRIKRIKPRSAKAKDSPHAPLYELAHGLGRNDFACLEEAVHFVSSRIADLSDGFLRHLFEKQARFDLLGLARNVQASLPGVFLILPFSLTLRHLNRNRQLVARLASDLGIEAPREGQRILWFTDTFDELNGVSVTLSEMSGAARDRGLDLKIAVVGAEQAGLPPNVLNLPSIQEIALPYYETYRLKVPSVLKSLREIYRFDPDRIYISTPGPAGLLGLLAAKLMSVRSVGFYHTDFALQARLIAEDSSVSRMLESYTRWFYSAMDEIRVPTLRYMDLLDERGFDPGKMRYFKRGIDLDLFTPRAAVASILRGRPNAGKGVTLLYAGRISRDKGMDLLMEVFGRLAAKRTGLTLLVVGDGPMLPELKGRTRSERVVFAGRIDHAELPAVYAAADLFVFPSTTDTFGRAVLEAQACGLPAVVSDAGGPQEIVVDGKTGHVARADDASDWVEKIGLVLDLIDSAPALYMRMRKDARKHAEDSYGGEEAMAAILEDDLPPAAGADKKIA